MKALEILLSRRWILKSREKELYYQLKDELGEVKKFLMEKMGYQVIVNPMLVKAEKVPAEPENWMGILEFKGIRDYVYFCCVLMFLEDKEPEEQFVLSELTEYVQGQNQEMDTDWTVYHHRRSLIRVIKFCVGCGMMNVNDGDEEGFAKDADSEVLYENTGVSKYFTRNFTRDIMGYTGQEDFLNEEWIDINADRGIVRRQRVYRNLIMSMGISKTDRNEEDFAYIRNYRGMLRGELEELFDCSLQIHRTSAFMVLGEESSMGRCFPEENTLSDIALLCGGLLLREVEQGKIEVPANERICISRAKFEQIIETCKTMYGNGFIKTYREKTTAELIREITQYMEELQLIQMSGSDVFVNPVVGKIAGEYPADFQQQNE